VPPASVNNRLRVKETSEQKNNEDLCKHGFKRRRISQIKKKTEIRKKVLQRQKVSMEGGCVKCQCLFLNEVENRTQKFFWKQDERRTGVNQ